MLIHNLLYHELEFKGRLDLFKKFGNCRVNLFSYVAHNINMTETKKCIRSWVLESWNTSFTFSKL
jgi:hypothetical protein